MPESVGEHTLPSMFRSVSLAVLLLASVWSCSPFGHIVSRNAVQLFRKPKAVANKITKPRRKDARLTVLWVGHATALVQIDDKFILTDPVFTDTVGQISKRLVEPGIDPEHLPSIDACLISHMHFDHLSLGTLDIIEDKVKQLLVPRGGLVYVPNYDFPSDEVWRWHSFHVGEMRITAVPVLHKGFRYAADKPWMPYSFTGWVIEYHGITVYFGGDTAYDGKLFRQTAQRFPSIDLALLPIGPVKPRDFMAPHHVDGEEAVRAFFDLRARFMVPVHYDTFIHGEDEPGEALRLLRKAARSRSLAKDRLRVLPIGAQATLISRRVTTL